MKIDILKSSFETLDFTITLRQVLSWAETRESRTVVFCNVHSAVTASRESSFHTIINRADILAPDGAPIAWAMRRKGATGQQRINGPDFMWQYLSLAEPLGQSIFLYGGQQETLELLQQKIRGAFPKLRIAGALSPPFRALSPAEDDEVVRTINASAAQTVWVSLGCPKQERWMEQNRDRIQAVMLGVGAAFGYHAGTLPRAPLWMQDAGLEWLYRLAHEPRTLWQRYFCTNTIFLIWLIKDFMRLSR